MTPAVPDGPLDARSRSVLAIAMMVARGRARDGDLARHCRLALDQKLLTPGELRELVFHGTLYLGYPTVRAAMRTAAEVVAAAEGSRHA